MQAPGHEAIQKELADFWQRISEQFGNADTEPYLTGKCMYMGNWLTDYSQLFAPDFFFDFKYNLHTQLQDMQDVFLTHNQYTKHPLCVTIESGVINHQLSIVN
jgi:hypothetical protein